ncbi:hypothetical protein N665_0584s0023 [Sinapis alba]|nr:hypothetical protein N665_0584s0023 [Sinapis alba]
MSILDYVMMVSIRLESMEDNILYEFVAILLGLIDLDTALCLCTVLKRSILDIIINIPIHLNLALNACGGTLTDEFHCPT